jgi:cyclopropane-fatty-acyl-phospholipid synthase
MGQPAISVRLWDAFEFPAPTGPTYGCLVIRDRATLWRLLTNPLLTFGEAYAAERLELEGSLPDLLTEIYRAHRHRASSSNGFCRWSSAWRRRRRNSLVRSRDNVHHHYDLGNEFYRLWLDDQLVYTCAYFREPGLTLEEAQVAKMEHVCRKLQLRAGQTVLEAGCGWGALALHMAKHYNVRVKAFNVSREQLRFARERAKREGLSDRVTFIDDDWRNIRDRGDVFVSVGMLEHVGPSNYQLLGRVMDHCLPPDGRGLIHTIGQNTPGPINPWIQRRIFPGAYPPTIAEMMRVFESCRFSVLDLENLRLHYAETLRHWLQRYDGSAAAVRTQLGREFDRTWRLYLAGSMAAFESGCLQLFQVLFTRAANNEIPWTRAYIYSLSPEP